MLFRPFFLLREEGFSKNRAGTGCGFNSAAGQKNINTGEENESL
jgi:hypothetical protein